MLCFGEVKKKRKEKINEDLETKIVSVSNARNARVLNVSRGNVVTLNSRLFEGNGIVPCARGEHSDSIAEY